MSTSFACDETFANIDFTVSGLTHTEFDNCTFANCNFSGMHMENMKFLDCRFTECNLSLAKLGNVVLSNTVFEKCKLLGLLLHECNQLGFTPSFTECVMDNCSFYRLKMQGRTFSKNRFREADFSEADLSGSTFEECDFFDAAFDGTNLREADLRTSFAFSIDPDKNFIAKARFSLQGLPGLLGKYNIKIDGLS